MIYPTMFLSCESYQNLPLVTKVLNSKNIPYKLPVFLGNMSIQDCTVYEISEMADEPVLVPFNGYEIMCGKPWIDIESDYINQSEGQHIYKVSMINKYSQDVFDLFFSYIVQNDNPDKPYIYMKRNGDNSEGNNCK